MTKTIFLVGPTATGKTDLALRISQNFPVEIVNADSRQIYEGMTIGSGKDIPKNAVKKMSGLTLYGRQIVYYQTPTTKLWGYDLVEPRDDFSVAHFYQFATRVIEQCKKNDNHCLVVGGSGFYINALYSPPASLSIPQNSDLRVALEQQSLESLQTKLMEVDQVTYKKLNNSDLHNRRRLVRKLEIALYLKNHHQLKHSKKDKQVGQWFGLDVDSAQIDQKITIRVAERLQAGFIEECEALYDSGMLREHYKSATATGYREWLLYKNKKLTYDEFVFAWITAEKQYARRQKTWFKKQPHITWIDPTITDPYPLVVEKLSS